ncbi:MAG: hypothetical protein M3Z11_07490 [Candidatus Dormibacteraeota bacterium]|nr:hypothetical protein [Candidatus Dormibacteraeota bacterium]
MLSTGVVSSAQTAQISTTPFTQQINDCSARYAVTHPAAGLGGETAKEAAAAFLEATNAQSEVAGEANFKLGEFAAEATTDEADGAPNTADLTAEVTAIVNAACEELKAIKAEYDAAVADLTAPATPVADIKPEVKTPEVEKPEVEKPEVEKPEVQKPEVHKPELEKAGNSKGND